MKSWRSKRDINATSPEIPDELVYLWDWFLEHAIGLGSNGMGPSLVTWESLLAWCQMGGPRLEYWEAMTLMRLGLVRASVDAEHHRKAAKKT